MQLTRLLLTSLEPGGAAAGAPGVYRASMPRPRRILALVLAAALAGGGLAACGGVAGRMTIAATPDRILDDQRAHITVAGLVPGATVLVTASVTDASDTAWTSTATFRADGHGRLDVDHAAPLHGSYHGVDGGGLLWSMTPASGQPDAMLAVPSSGGQEVVFTADSGGRSATTTIARTVAPATVHVQPVTVATDGLYGVYAAPSALTAGSSPAVVIWGGSEGGLSTTADAELLAAHGIPTLALAYFGEPGLPAGMTDIPIEYFEKAVAWIGRQPGVDPQRIIVDGISRGAEAALLTSAYDPRVAGVISIVGNDSVVCGLPGCVGSAWSLAGRPLPAFDARSGQPNNDPAAYIPVIRIGGRLLDVCGFADGEWNSCAYQQNLLLRRPKRPGDVYFAFAGVGHEIGATWPYEAGNVLAGVETSLGVTPAADERAREQLWPAMLAFITGITPSPRG